MKFIETMMAWDPETDRIRVGAWPDETGWSDRFMMTTGACEMRVHKMTPDQQRALLFVHFNTIVVRDQVPVRAAHGAFLHIDEYRWSISPNMKGATAMEKESIG